MRDYQQKKMKVYLFPEPVYRQSYWALRDLNRMKEELKRLNEERDVIAVGEKNMSNYGFGTGRISDITGNRAVKIAHLSSRILAIEAAFDEIPEKYRRGLWRKNVENLGYPGDAHINTWKKWQQILMYHVAKNLQIY